MSSELVNRREALEELVQSDGWRIFVQHVRNEWQGDGYMTRMGLALGKDAIEPQVVHRTALEVIRTLEWPMTQIRELAGEVDE